MMKAIIKGIAILLVIFIAALNTNLVYLENEFSELIISKIETLAVNESDCPDDEMAFCMTGECPNGSTCECNACMKGSTDCTPNCPCC